MSSFFPFILIVTVTRLARPGGLRSVVAESALLRHQLLILNRGRKRAPNLRPADRIITGLCMLFMHPVLLENSICSLVIATCTCKQTEELPGR
jgi:hypothetical protein